MWFQRVMADHGPCPYKPLKVCRSQIKKRMGLCFLNFLFFVGGDPCALSHLYCWTCWVLSLSSLLFLSVKWGEKQ